MSEKVFVGNGHKGEDLYMVSEVSWSSDGTATLIGMTVIKITKCILKYFQKPLLVNTICRAIL